MFLNKTAFMEWNCDYGLVLVIKILLKNNLLHQTWIFGRIQNLRVTQHLRRL